jgi:Asp-tRNA(Asn)/Glu-tRNA(Gln) amidotransferase A subunit family amidase/anaerobic selenocysteine-containing dehydrogenase/GMP synthase-like glutamine amidotransferase
LLLERSHDQSREVNIMPEVKELVRTTCPRDCYDACGIVVVKQGEDVVRVKGDPDHAVSRGTLCGKCALVYNGAWRDPNQRLTKPLKRIGAKGQGQFVPISWEEAIATIADRLKVILATSGGISVLQTHYTGTCSLIAGAFPLRFFNRIGATEVDPDTVCNKAGHVALQMIFGDSLTGFDPRTAKDANCILVWGANPSASAPHAHKHWLREATGKVIVIDPIRHPTAQAADLHLQPFPGTDGALAFALLHVIHREGLVNDEFLNRYTLGWEEVLPLLPDCTPEWGEAVTGVPAAKIEEAAKLYGQGPSLLWLGQGLQRQPTGGNVFRACTLLPIATGNLGKPGAGFLYMNGTGNRGIDGDYLPAPRLHPGEPHSISHMDLAECLADAKSSRALFCWNNNIVASSPKQRQLRQALEREDLFTVSIELFATDTTDYADIVLPAASFLEFDDLVLSYFNYSISAQVKAMEPLGEALPNQEIFRRLAAAMDFEETELYESDRTLIDTLLKQTGTVLNFNHLAKIGTVDYTAEPIIQFADLTFATPSSKIEIASDQFVTAGLSRAPQPFADARPAHGKLRVLSPASPWLMNSSYGNDANIRKQISPAEVLINPKEARSRGLESGTPVCLKNETGQLTLQVTLSEDVPCGVALVYKGRWLKLDPSRANVNVLNPGHKTDLAESSCVHSVEVDLIPMHSEQVKSMNSAISEAPFTIHTDDQLTKTAICLRHVPFEDLGSFEPVLRSRGYQVTYLESSMADLSTVNPLEVDLLVILGGPIGVYETEDYPFLAAEIALIQKRLMADLPTLGICLGCQLMARALGAAVYPGNGKEIGWSPLILTEAGYRSPLVAIAPEKTPVVHWHGDTFDLPAGAILLASTEQYKHQAFSWGKCGLALQFHPEVTQQGLESWFVGHTLEINTTPGISVMQLRTDTTKWGTTLEAQSATLLNDWLDRVEAEVASLSIAQKNGWYSPFSQQNTASDIAYMSAIDLVAHYRDRTLSPVEVARHLLDRIAELNPKLNAFRLVDEETTLAMAKASEQRWLSGEPCGSLDGIPVSIKDLVTTKGWSTLRGSKAIDPNQAWTVDAPVVARLREQGAVFLGKTTTPESGHKVVTQSPLTGITYNPWDLQKTPGGSSGGAAAALASGLGPIAVGTDGAGSIRIPASFCGVFGLKPTWGRVPIYPVSTFGRMSTIGPMSRTVADAALMYNVIAQPDQRDCFALPDDDRDYLQGLEAGIKGLKIAFSPTLGQPCSVDPEVAKLVADAAMTFQELGTQVETVDLKWSFDLMEMFLPIWYASYANFLRLYSPQQLQLMDPDLLAVAAEGNRLSLLDYFEAMNQRGIICAQVQELFNQYDLLLTPTMPIAAFEAGRTRPEGYQDDWSWVPFTYLFNLTEQPAASVPCGFTQAGLPVALQIAGPLYSDALILRASYSYEQARPFYKRHPSL